MKYLYRIAFQGRSDKLGVHTFRFIAAHSVHEVLIIAGYEYEIGVAYGVPVLEVKIDKDIKAGGPPSPSRSPSPRSSPPTWTAKPTPAPWRDYLPEYQTTKYERTSYDQ